MNSATRFLAWYRRFYLLVNLPVLFLATELAMSWLDPVSWSHSSNLDQALSRYRSSPPGNSPVLLVLGSSVARSGIDQSAVESGLRTHGQWRVYNFGLNTARIDDEVELLEYLSHQGINARAILLCVNLYSLKEAESDTRYPWHRRRSPYVFYHRNYLFNALKARVSQLIVPKQVRPYSQFANAMLTPDELDAQAQSFIASFAQRPRDELPMLEELSVLLRWITDHGIRVYVALLPMHPLASNFDRYPALVAAIRARVPPGSLDLTQGAYPKELFDDIGHFNDRGRRLLIAQIVEWLGSINEVRSP